mmetsp:Transcript_12734/g.40155  ORF Transcript_12734/g.40155 Transcript_12734/m.40155 type:complete len:283 (-) Transcript_12734:109-957(-)|eukprot:CAMPEP_0204603106 /NCGR_PEP_ID=MMETSP0661-20131031/57063_1 /ASSEMBLY_ACC=CAM_ASM_000606 /TAXON_ID=109239 /ORGANISM="Alexandrium margalefi, Strain AMGDE01CS-322" /LENGTH=282 /DNA_ID=CAMNT_0051614145 /DNA_START=75 /DNA_END=923 /DNA_ORIENTATION=-
MAAGTFKYRNDEYFLKHGDPLYDPHWPAKEYEKMRSTLPKEYPAPRPELKSLTGTMGLNALSQRSERSSRSGAAVPASPARQPEPPAHLVRKVRGGRPESKNWSWCLPKGDRMQELGPGLEPADALGLHRTLSSPSTLTDIGQQERVRVLGTHGNNSPASALRATSSSYRPMSRNATPSNGALKDTSGMMGRSATLQRLPGEGQRSATSVSFHLQSPRPDEQDSRQRSASFTLPQTDNQKYGSRLHEALPVETRHNKNTCDVCVFADAANKALTPYYAHIRF